MEIILSAPDMYQKVAKASKWTSDKGIESHRVDIRTFWIEGEKRNPTKKGVMLQLNEYIKMMPWLFHRVESKDIFEETSIPMGPKKEIIKKDRVIQIKKNADKPYMMDIVLNNTKGESLISLTVSEVNELWSNQGKICNFFKEN